jgi:hypothetical protein
MPYFIIRATVSDVQLRLQPEWAGGGVSLRMDAQTPPSKSRTYENGNSSPHSSALSPSLVRCRHATSMTTPPGYALRSTDPLYYGAVIRPTGRQWPRPQLLLHVPCSELSPPATLGGVSSWNRWSNQGKSWSRPRVRGRIAAPRRSPLRNRSSASFRCGPARAFGGHPRHANCWEKPASSPS